MQMPTTKLEKKIKWLIILICMNSATFGQNKTPTYTEVLEKYKKLDSLYLEAKLITYGRTDCGLPLQLFVITKSKLYDPKLIHQQKKCVMFINNGIHPGEPDGIDASIKISEELLSSSDKRLDNVVILIIPVFNIDGSLYRNCCSRANQNGPEEYGFRANAKNYDLNRDFTKDDAGNTKAIKIILNQWDPDFCIDTHVSDGADYQYTMTLISSQHDKMESSSGKFIKEVITPKLFEKMKSRKDEMIPYVQTVNDYDDVPDSGISAFLETPRFLSGYQSLCNRFSFISESHMLKPFDNRVKSTYNFLQCCLDVCHELGDKIIEKRFQADQETMNKKYYSFNYELDRSKKEDIIFNGYEADYKTSTITGDKRLYYNRQKPYQKKIPFYDHYIPKDSILIPKYFYIPQAWYEIVRMLEQNGVTFIMLDRDSLATVSTTYITDYKTTDHPYEGHYLHFNVKTKSEKRIVNFTKGDYLIPMPQKNMKFALETLVPQSSDSYFCWGFFDSFLQQKEGFSSYVFEDLAETILKEDEKLKSNFEMWKNEHENSSSYEKLDYIYQRSKYFEKTYNRYPVFSVY
jgi:hypothetical protein